MPKITFYAIGCVLLLSITVFGQKTHRPLQLSNQEKKRVIEFVVKDGLSRIEKRMEVNRESLLRNCPLQKKNEEQLLIVSTNLIKIDFIPKIKGYQFIFEPFTTIKSQYEKGEDVCFVEITQFEIINKQLRIQFWKSFRRSGYIYAEGVYYEFKKNRRKWRGKYIHPLTLES